MRRFENDTFESVFFKSVEIESVVVSAYPHYYVNHRLFAEMQQSTHVYLKRRLEVSFLFVIFFPFTCAAFGDLKF